MAFRALGDKLHLTPLAKGRHLDVLDIGTGSGIWAKEFAQLYPNTLVTGTDLSPSQDHSGPVNCLFIIDDCELDWTFKPDSFDYIHIRALAGCVEDWGKFYPKCFYCLKPGGKIEHQEYELPVTTDLRCKPQNWIWDRWGSIFLQYSEKTGRPFNVSGQWESKLDKAGFSHIQSESFHLPIGGWPDDEKLREIGFYNGLAFEVGLEGFTTYICTETLGWGLEEARALIKETRAAVLQPGDYLASYSL